MSVDLPAPTPQVATLTLRVDSRPLVVCCKLPTLKVALNPPPSPNKQKSRRCWWWRRRRRWTEARNFAFMSTQRRPWLMWEFLYFTRDLKNLDRPMLVGLLSRHFAMWVAEILARVNKLLFCGLGEYEWRVLFPFNFKRDWQKINFFFYTWKINIDL